MALQGQQKSFGLASCRQSVISPGYGYRMGLGLVAVNICDKQSLSLIFFVLLQRRSWEE